MLKIEENWEKIKQAVKLAFELVSSFGFSNDNLRSNNTVTPIAYYLMKRDCPGRIIHSQDEENNRRKIKTWMIRTILKRSFSGAPEGVITRIRKIVETVITLLLGKIFLYIFLKLKFIKVSVSSIL